MINYKIESGRSLNLVLDNDEYSEVGSPGWPHFGAESPTFWAPSHNYYLHVLYCMAMTTTHLLAVIVRELWMIYFGELQSSKSDSSSIRIL